MLTLIPMTPGDLARYLHASVQEYVRQSRLSGLPAVAIDEKEAAAYMQSLLPQGLDTPGHVLRWLQDAHSGAQVGAMWFAEVEESAGALTDMVTSKSAFLYDLHIDPPYRRRGYGSAALHALQEEATLRGLCGISLNVFAHNNAAQALYRKLGFVASEISMIKPLLS